MQDSASDVPPSGPGVVRIPEMGSEMRHEEERRDGVGEGSCGMGETGSESRPEERRDGVGEGSCGMGETGSESRPEAGEMGSVVGDDSRVFLHPFT